MLGPIVIGLDVERHTPYLFSQLSNSLTLILLLPTISHASPYSDLAVSPFAPLVQPSGKSSVRLSSMGREIMDSLGG